MNHSCVKYMNMAADQQNTNTAAMFIFKTAIMEL